MFICNERALLSLFKEKAGSVLQWEPLITNTEQSIRWYNSFQTTATTDFCMTAVLFLSFFFFSCMCLKHDPSLEGCAYLAERHAQGKHGLATKI